MFVEHCIDQFGVFNRGSLARAHTKDSEEQYKMFHDDTAAHSKKNDDHQQPRSLS